MIVWTDLKHFKKTSKVPLVVALGNFDGVHVGHKKILQTTIERSKKIKGTPCVLTFAEHPQRVLHHSSEPKLLTSAQHRLFLFQELKVDTCFLLHFTLAFAKTDAETFVRDWLVGKLGAREIHLGYNAHFGNDRKGDVRMMARLAKELGFEFHEASPVKVEGEYVSSSLIRKVIEKGDLSQAGQFLGRPFSIFANVVRGKARGKGLGFPTANLRPHSEILPPRGVYPVEVRESNFHMKRTKTKSQLVFISEKRGKWRKGILNYGVRPTFGKNNLEVPEVFLFNYSGDLYGKTLEVIFHPKLRNEKTFKGAGELVKAIEEDIFNAERYFNEAAKKPLQGR